MPRGGYRPGAGRPKSGSPRKAPKPVAALPVSPPDTLRAPDVKELTPLEYLLSVMNDPAADEARRDRAAMAAAPLLHAKAGESGKKGERQRAAETTSKGRFAPAAPPKLVVNNR